MLGFFYLGFMLRRQRFFGVLRRLAVLRDGLHEGLDVAPPPEPQLHRPREDDRRAAGQAGDVHLHHRRLRLLATAPHEARPALRRDLALHHPAAAASAGVARVQDPDDEPLASALDVEPRAPGHPDVRRADEGAGVAALRGGGADAAGAVQASDTWPLLATLPPLTSSTVSGVSGAWVTVTESSMDSFTSHLLTLRKNTLRLSQDDGSGGVAMATADPGIFPMFPRFLEPSCSHQSMEWMGYLSGQEVSVLGYSICNNQKLKKRC